MVIAYSLLGIQLRSMAHEKATGVPSEPPFRFPAFGKLLSWRWLASALMLVMLQLAPSWIKTQKEDLKYVENVRNWELVDWLDVGVQFLPAVIFVLALTKTLLSVGELIDDFFRAMEALAPGTVIKKNLAPIWSIAAKLLKATGLQKR